MAEASARSAPQQARALARDTVEDAEAALLPASDSEVAAPRRPGISVTAKLAIGIAAVLGVGAVAAVAAARPGAGVEDAGRSSARMQPADVASDVQLGADMQSSGESSGQTAAGGAPLGSFCGVAKPDGVNQLSAAGLGAVVAEAGQGNVWTYNWGLKPMVSAAGASFIPTIKFPGMDVSALPQAGANGVGHIIKGWNEPDDPRQAGRSKELRTQPESYAKQWVTDMEAAKAKGYTQYISPAIAHDTLWLDFFLKGCEQESGCKDMITYLACHRYQPDCKSYKADADSMGWRDDLSYLLTMHRLMKKYNARGFKIKGIVMDELGCLASDYWHGAPEEDQMQYLNDFYRDTIVAVKTGDAKVEAKIKKTPYIMPKGPDALAEGSVYKVGGEVAVDGGPNAGEEAVAAIKSLVSVAWFSEWPKQDGVRNDLLQGDGHTQRLSALGQAYVDACKKVD